MYFEATTVLEQNLEMSRFRLASIASDDQKVTFYTGFPSYKALMACFKFLGPGVHSLETAGLNCMARNGGKSVITTVRGILFGSGATEAGPI